MPITVSDPKDVVKQLKSGQAVHFVDKKFDEKIYRTKSTRKVSKLMIHEHIKTGVTGQRKVARKAVPNKTVIVNSRIIRNN